MTPRAGHTRLAQSGELDIEAKKKNLNLPDAQQTGGISFLPTPRAHDAFSAVPDGSGRGLGCGIAAGPPC